MNTSEMWLCEACHSLNRPGTAKCYSCRSPQAVPAIPSASLWRETAAGPGPVLGRDDAVDDCVEATEPTIESGTTKVCPQCAESVKVAARICRFCRYSFEEATPPLLPAPVSSASGLVQPASPFAGATGLSDNPTPTVVGERAPSRRTKRQLVGWLAALAILAVFGAPLASQYLGASHQATATTNPTSCSISAMDELWTTDNVAPFVTVTVDGPDAQAKCASAFNGRLPTRGDPPSRWSDSDGGGPTICTVGFQGDTVTVESDHGRSVSESDFANRVCQFLAAGSD